MSVIVLEKRLERDTSSIACPECNGYCDKVESTKEEVKEHQTCGRKQACCMSTFVCRVCKERIVAKLNAPESGW